MSNAGWENSGMYRGVGLRSTRLVQDSEAEARVLAVRLADLDHGVNVAHRRDELGHKRPQPRLEILNLRLEPKFFEKRKKY